MVAAAYEHAYGCAGTRRDMSARESVYSYSIAARHTRSDVTVCQHDAEKINMRRGVIPPDPDTRARRLRVATIPARHNANAR